MNAIAFFLSPLGKAAAIAAAVIGILWAADHRGYQRAESACQTAGLKAKIATLEADKEASDQAAKRFAADASRNAEIAAKNSAIIEEFRHAPRASSCLVSPDAANRSRRLRANDRP